METMIEIKIEVCPKFPMQPRLSKDISQLVPSQIYVIDADFRL